MNVMKKWRKIQVICVIIASMLVVQFIRDYGQILAQSPNAISDLAWKISYVKTQSKPLVDNPAIYGDDAADTVVNNLYVTVLPTKDDQGKLLKFIDMNMIFTHDVEVPKLNAVVEESPARDLLAGEALPKPTRPSPCAANPAFYRRKNPTRSIISRMGLPGMVSRPCS